MCKFEPANIHTVYTAGNELENEKKLDSLIFFLFLEIISWYKDLTRYIFLKSG